MQDSSIRLTVITTIAGKRLASKSSRPRCIGLKHVKWWIMTTKKVSERKTRSGVWGPGSGEGHK